MSEEIIEEDEIIIRNYRTSDYEATLDQAMVDLDPMNEGKIYG